MPDCQSKARRDQSRLGAQQVMLYTVNNEDNKQCYHSKTFSTCRRDDGMLPSVPCVTMWGPGGSRGDGQ